MEHFKPYMPSQAEISGLIEEAKKQDQVDFLKLGDLGSVAIFFEAHAFAVEKAREKLSYEN
jgi:hypothetical protein